MKTSQPTKENNSRKFNIYMQRKLAFTYLVVAAVLFALAIKTVMITRNNGEEYSRIALAQRGYSTETSVSRRGTITDRNYTMLAYSEEVYNLILDPSVILYTLRESEPSPNKNCTLDALVSCYGFSRADLEKVLAEKPDSAYVRYARRLSESERDIFLEYQESYNSAKDESGKKLHSDKVTGVWFESEYKRVYPYKTLAATVLGFSGADASEGHWGLEEYYNNELTGLDGKSYSYLNNDGFLERSTVEPVNGHTIVSTIDFTLQRIVEEHIAAYKAENPCRDIGVLLMDPSNGEILAMATDKRYDPNQPMEMGLSYTAEELAAMDEDELGQARNAMWRNFTVNDTYVPGSVSKELTVALALEENKVTPDSLFECDGGENIMGTYVKCSGLHDTLTLREALMKSCNDALMNIAGRVSVMTFLRYQYEFGLGRKTGIDLPGEAAGILFSESSMTALDLATSSFGQGFTSSMVQMAAAYSALINGGYYYQPHMVRQILDENGGLVRNITPVLVRQIVTEDTSAFLREAAEATVSEGSGYTAMIPGYSIGGKTGTAQKYPLEDNKFVISFMAFSPAQDAKILIYVVVNEPYFEEPQDLETVSAHDAVVLEREIMESVLPYLGVKRDWSQVPDVQPAPAPAEDTQTQQD